MKKTLLILFSLLLFNLTFSDVFSGKTIRNAQFSDLPELSQKFILAYFDNSQIEYISIESSRKAEVDLSDGTRLLFGKNGYWKSAKNEEGIILYDWDMLPDGMANYLKEFQSKYLIHEIVRQDLCYEVKISAKRKIILRFSLNGDLLGEI